MIYSYLTSNQSIVEFNVSPQQFGLDLVENWPLEAIYEGLMVQLFCKNRSASQEFIYRFLLQLIDYKVVEGGYSLIAH